MAATELLPIGVLLDILYYAVNHAISTRLEQSGFPGIRAAHGKVFEHIGTGMHVQEMAERAQVTKQSMAELVLHLERYGYLERVPDPLDRRAKIVRLTNRGGEAVAMAETILEGIYREWRGVLGDNKFDELQVLLSEIAAITPGIAGGQSLSEEG
jgi:DNA-binding MarR family transcriptional regulator